ncbi:thioredoxin family protein [Persicobacter sp. CCB-QB2]|uniref:thioredoxin family protein n=1 Tax=Persicobacter sp. CCB-QB2 TaxID=1561025 RepID=UPI0006A97C17|nr:thioredoxin family protein [Persicobacter sp. CCB-QB2]
MKKYLLTVLTMLMVTFAVSAQETNWRKIYNPSINGEEQIAAAVNQAKKEGKKVLVQVGGNWCKFCIRLNKYVMTDAELKKMIDDNYVYVHLNYSKENKNEALLEKWGNPNEHGFPVYVFLDENGKLTNVQETGSLEEGETYNKGKLEKVYRENAG